MGCGCLVWAVQALERATPQQAGVYVSGVMKRVKAQRKRTRLHRGTSPSTSPSNHQPYSRGVQEVRLPATQRIRWTWLDTAALKRCRSVTFVALLQFCTGPHLVLEHRTDSTVEDQLHVAAFVQVTRQYRFYAPRQIVGDQLRRTRDPPARHATYRPVPTVCTQRLSPHAQLHTLCNNPPVPH